MSTKTEIKITKWCPEGFAECLAGMTGQVQDVCERLAEQAGGLNHFKITVTNEPRYKDATYNVSRPIARAYPVGTITADAYASADEAENKTMSKAVSG